MVSPPPPLPPELIVKIILKKQGEAGRGGCRARADCCVCVAGQRGVFQTGRAAVIPEERTY